MEAIEREEEVQKLREEASREETTHLAEGKLQDRDFKHSETKL